MAYVALATLRSYLGISTSAADVRLQACIDAAQAFIDGETGRTFGADAYTVRVFDAVRDVDGAKLNLGIDLASTAAATNGDGTAISSGNFTYEPRNGPPYYALVLKASSGLAWTYTSDPEGAISISGKWGYAATAPADIVQACLLIAAHQYRLQDNPGDADRLISADGIVIVPSSVPRFAQAIIQRYRRLQF